MGFNGAETNCGIAHILGILLMNSYDSQIFRATTICRLSRSLNTIVINFLINIIVVVITVITISITAVVVVVIFARM